MKLLLAGIGTGDCGLITLRALEEAKAADVIIVPRSSPDAKGLAERVITHYFPTKPLMPLTFPMTTDMNARTQAITSQAQAIFSGLKADSTIFFPVIGDAMLYSTARYFIDVMATLKPDITITFIPGISTHSLAAAYGKKFLAMKDEIFCVIPGTADADRISAALNVCNCAAIYKPTALKNISDLARGFHVMRVDYAGFPDLERIIEGAAAMKDIDEYLSIILLWRE